MQALNELWFYGTRKTLGLIYWRYLLILDSVYSEGDFYSQDKTSQSMNFYTRDVSL